MAAVRLSSVAEGGCTGIGFADIVLDGKIQYATKVEKQQLWKDAVATFTGAPNVPFQLISGESTRPGDEGRSAVVCSIETESEGMDRPTDGQIA